MARILICGTWHGDRAAAIERIRARGCEIEQCSESTGPLECVVRHAPDVLLYGVESGRPWECGMLGLIHRVHPWLPVVVVTHDGSVEERLRLDPIRPSFVAVDPIEPDELCAVIDALIARRTALSRRSG
jgi:hypothetical protein